MITQFSILLIFGVGLLIVRWGEESASHHYPRSARFLWIVFGFTLLTLGVLFAAEDFARIWKPVFGQPSMSGLSLNEALGIVLTCDAVCSALLIYHTHGSMTSPFSPVLFAIPALAIFLRQPPGYVIYYAILVTALFTILIPMYQTYEQSRITLPYETAEEGCARGILFWFVAVAVFALTTYIGLITRPA